MEMKIILIFKERDIILILKLRGIELFFLILNMLIFGLLKKKVEFAINNLKKQKIDINFRNILFEVINQLVKDDNEKNIYHFPFIVFHNHEKKYKS